MSTQEISTQLVEAVTYGKTFLILDRPIQFSGYEFYAQVPRWQELAIIQLSHVPEISMDEESVKT